VLRFTKKARSRWDWWRIRQTNENDMQKRHSKSARNGTNGPKSLKSGDGGSRKNGYVHVISPATASEIRRALGIKPSDTRNVMRAFAAAGVKV
jgi:hypothetical protein